MIRAKGRYRNQTLELEEPLALAEGTAVEIDIRVQDGARGEEEDCWADVAMARLEEEWDNSEDAIYDLPRGA